MPLVMVPEVLDVLMWSGPSIFFTFGHVSIDNVIGVAIHDFVVELGLASVFW